MGSNSSVKRWLQALNFFYPPFCLHCKDPLPDCRYPFCAGCATLFERIDPISRCSCCFEEKDLCQKNSKRPFRLLGIGAACEYRGPAATLVKRLKREDNKGLSQGAAALMVQQLIELKWPLPDVIVPVPISLVRLLDRGHNQSLLLAHEIGQLLDRPVVEALRRKSGSLKQAGLNRDKREQQSLYSFSLRGGGQTTGKTALLIDDVLTTGTTLANCAEILIEDLPAQIYALSFTKAD